jgi:hypothetical protein
LSNIRNHCDARLIGSVGHCKHPSAGGCCADFI